MKFRKRPAVIEAVQWHPNTKPSGFPQWFWDHFGRNPDCVKEDGGLMIETLEGIMLASVGDWIIRGVKGELYPCKPDIFEATYEPID